MDIGKRQICLFFFMAGKMFTTHSEVRGREEWWGQGGVVRAGRSGGSREEW